VEDCLLAEETAPAVPVVPLDADALAQWLESCDEAERRWVEAIGFRAKAGTHCPIPGADGSLVRVLAGIESADDPFALAHLPALLPAGAYRIEADWPADVHERAAVGWGLGTYQFTRYKQAEPLAAKLVVDAACDARRARRQIEAVVLVRDLVNTPAADMMPEDLAAAAEHLAAEHGGRVNQVVGDELVTSNYPAIHAVGRAATRPPRLIDLHWGDESHPKITLVGKGVCFDSGGLDIKSANGMRLMKKDMGGAAHALGLARLVMAAALPVRLRVLVPAVENAVSGNAYRPGDVVRTRQGLTVEIDNTDAEGRVVLCDALAEAAAEAPELIVDFATLTGAARVALGTDVPAMFCNRDDVADALLETGRRVHDPMWRLPLHAPYRELIDSKVADIANSAPGPYAGAITAALFLERFVPNAVPWVHFDLMAWNVRARPGRPEGGEAMGIRALDELLRERYGQGD